MLCIQTIRQSRRNKAFSVKLCYADIRNFFNSCVFTQGSGTVIAAYGDNRNIFNDRFWVLYNDNFFIAENSIVVITRSVCEKQRVIRIQLAELTQTDMQPEHHTLPQRLIDIRSDK